MSDSQETVVLKQPGYSEAKFEDVMLEDGAKPPAVVKPGLSSRLSSLASPLLASSHPLPSSLPSRLLHSLLCPPHGALALLLTYSLAALTTWAAAYTILGQVALPGTAPITVTLRGGTVFALLALLGCSWVAGWLVQQAGLPPLLGMLLTGIVLTNVPYIDVARGLDPSWSSAVRSTALAVILLRAGLGLDPGALRKLSGVVFRLAFVPCLVESSVVMVASHLLLGLPWLWGAMLGFVLAAVSPAVVVPCLLALQEQGWGRAKGIPTLVIAAASVDDVLAISCFTILLGITFNSSADLASVILQGPLEALVGVCWGLAWGALATFLPPQPSPSPALRLTILGGGALLALFGCDLVSLPGAGALAVLTMAFTAGLGWRTQGWTDHNPVSSSLAGLWFVFQPLLFSFIGTEIRVSALSGATVGYGLLVLLMGLLCRLAASYLATLAGGLTTQERLFVALAWLPKATVQAAIGPLALDKATEALAARTGQNCSDILAVAAVNGSLGAVEVLGPSMVQEGGGLGELVELCSRLQYGQVVLTVAVLVILVTAPLGAVAIVTSGPRLLSKEGQGEEEEHEA